METLIGIVVGIIASVIVSHYYFRRAARKSLGIYRVLGSEIFSGIELDVREELSFTYRNREVKDLLQLEFLIANTGERAISNVIEPLQIRLPEGVELLDASILHRHPKALQASITTPATEGGDARVLFHFPLLNSGDFFLIKMLLSGKLRQHDDLTFTIVCDDLPRALPSSWLPQTAYQEGRLRVEWAPILGGLAVAAVAAWIIWALVLIHAARPELFPYPLATYEPSLESLVLLLPSFLLCGLLGMFAFFLILLTFGDTAGPRFPLPQELRRRGFHVPLMLEDSDASKSAPNQLNPGGKNGSA